MADKEPFKEFLWHSICCICPGFVSMKTCFAILITAILIAIGYIISAMAGFDVFWLLIPATSLWAAIDSAKLQMSRYKVALASRPAALFCVCALLWILTFPLYLITRQRIKNGEAELKGEIIGGPVRLFFRKMSKAASVTVEVLLVILYGLKLAAFVFLAEECWRGQRMWDHVQRELKAKGESIEFKDKIPPPVRDADNFYSAPRMSEWFVRPSGKDNKRIKPGELADRLNYTNGGPEVWVGELTLQASGTQPATLDKNTTILHFDDPEASRHVKELIARDAGGCAFGTLSRDIITTRSLNSIRITPLKVILVIDRKPNIKELLEFLNNQQSAGVFTLKATKTNTFQIFTTFCQASDYLKWSDQFNSEFGLMRDALKRPYARMAGDYSDPLMIPMPNWQNFRKVITTLAQRAQCYLLLGQPEKALQDLTLIDALRRTQEDAPTGKPMTLVATMINAATVELETGVIADGFHLRAWQEPQMAALQKQLEAITLTPYMAESLRCERASVWSMFQTRVMSKLETHIAANYTLWQKVKAVRPLDVARGVLYINMVKVVELDQKAMDGVDENKAIVRPQKIAEFAREDERVCRHNLPYGFLAAISVPNYTRAVQTLALNQDKANEAEIVCAMERYRLVRGTYPQSLNELAPQFIKELPHDIIGGGQFKYSRDDNDHFILYSIGWNETDDGGRINPAHPDSLEQGDWVWQ
jgi:hypothetical protein